MVVVVPRFSSTTGQKPIGWLILVACVQWWPAAVSDPAAIARRVAGNALGMLGARGVVAIAGLFSLPVVYARLGSADFGVWVLVSGLAAMTAVLDLGLGSAMVREVALSVRGDGRSRAPAVLAMGLVWAVGVALVALAAAMLGWHWLAGILHLDAAGGSARQAMAWALVVLLLSAVEGPWRSVLEGTQRYALVGVIGAAAAIVAGLLAVLAVQTGGGLVRLAQSAALVAALRTTTIVLAAHRHRPDLGPRLREIRRDDLGIVRRYGLRVQISSLAAGINTETDRLVLGAFFGPTLAGGFDLGTRLLNLLRLPPGYALIAMFPVAVANSSPDRRHWLDTFYLRATRVLALTLAPAAAALVVCAEPLVRLWLGRPVPWAVLAILVLAPSHALNLIFGAAATVTRAEGKPGRETRYALLSNALNLGATLPLLKLLGPLGVPLATSVAVVLSTGYLVHYFHRHTERPVRPLLRVVWPPVATALGVGLAVWSVAGWLPEGPGRLGAAVAVVVRAALVLVGTVGLLTLTGHLGAAEWSRVWRWLGPNLSRRPVRPALPPAMRSPAEVEDAAPPAVGTVPPVGRDGVPAAVEAVRDGVTAVVEAAGPSPIVMLGPEEANPGENRVPTRRRSGRSGRGPAGVNGS